MSVQTVIDMTETEVVDVLVEHLRAHGIGADDRWDFEAVRALDEWAHAALV